MKRGEGAFAMDSWRYVLADCVVAVHLAYVTYVLVGLVLIPLGWLARWSWVRNPWFRITHLLAILIVAVETRIGMECPLTTLESTLRGVENGGGFIGRMMHDLMFWDVPQPTLNAAYYVIASYVLLTFLLVPPNLRRRPARSDALPPKGTIDAHPGA